MKARHSLLLPLHAAAGVFALAFFPNVCAAEKFVYLGSQPDGIEVHVQVSPPVAVTPATDRQISRHRLAVQVDAKARVVYSVHPRCPIPPETRCTRTRQKCCATASAFLRSSPAPAPLCSAARRRQRKIRAPPRSVIR